MLRQICHICQSCLLSHSSHQSRWSRQAAPALSWLSTRQPQDALHLLLLIRGEHWAVRTEEPVILAQSDSEYSLPDYLTIWLSIEFLATISGRVIPFSWWTVRSEYNFHKYPTNISLKSTEVLGNKNILRIRRGIVVVYWPEVYKSSCRAYSWPAPALLSFKLCCFLLNNPTLICCGETYIDVALSNKVCSVAR